MQLVPRTSVSSGCWAEFRPAPKTFLPRSNCASLRNALAEGAQAVPEAGLPALEIYPTPGPWNALPGYWAEFLKAPTTSPTKIEDWWGSNVSVEAMVDPVVPVALVVPGDQGGLADQEAPAA